MEFETKIIHTGQDPDKTTGAIITPIYQSTVFAQDDIGQNKGYEYTRAGNPTRATLEKCLAAIENGKYCSTFSSGINAISAVFSLLRPNDHIITTQDLYGGTYRLIEEILIHRNITATYVDGCCPENFEKAITKNTKLIWIESPTNPLLKLIDIKAVAEICKKHKVLLGIDNTFATPYLQNPLELGADIVAHSTTKYINGHSDVMGGAVIVNSDLIFEQIKSYQYLVGGTPSPFDSWLTLRGLKTLNLRMDKHCKNAKSVAEFLCNHEFVEEVFYPGLKTNPQFELAKSQMKDFGGVVSFKIKGDRANASEFFKKLKLFNLTVSLGGVESLACYPAYMTHSAIPEEKRQKLGIDNNLIRLSIGIENINDLCADIDNALRNSIVKETKPEAKITGVDFSLFRDKIKNKKTSIVKAASRG